MSLLKDWARESAFALSPEARASARTRELAQPMANPFQQTQQRGNPNFPKQVGTGIDYGTFTGRGGGGARFFGEGVVRLRPGGSASASPPFFVSPPGRSGGGTMRVTVQPGTLNGMLASNYLTAMSNEGIKTSANGFIVLEAQSDGRVITSFKIAFQAGDSGPAPVAPTTPMAPTRFSWPIAWVIATTTQGASPRTRMLIGASSLIASIRETGRIPNPVSTPSEPGYMIYYTWIVSNSLEPTFVSLTGEV